jgi:hypothetical protein
MMEQEVPHMTISSYVIQSRHIFNLFLSIATTFLTFVSQAQSLNSQLQQNDDGFSRSNCSIAMTGFCFWLETAM